MRRSLAIIATAMLVAAGCSQAPTGQNPASPGASGNAVAEKPIPGGTLVEAISGDPKSFNPVLVTDTTSEDYSGKVYLSLLTKDPKTGELAGLLAKSWKLSPDNLTLTYTLRDGLEWSDGVAFSGEDYKYTAEAVMRSKRTTRQTAFENVVGAKDYKDGKTDDLSGIQVLDGGKTIQIKFDKPLCSAPQTLAGAGAGQILPSHSFLKYFDPHTKDTSKTIDDNPLNNAPPASMGPWIFKEFKPGDHATYEKNPKFFLGQPLIDQLVIKEYANATAIKSALEVGEATFGSAEPQDYEELSKNPELQGFEFPDTGWTYLGLDPDSPKAPWLADKHVRQALWYGLDRQAIINKILFGHGKLLYGAQPPASVATYKDSDLNHYPFDPKKAKSLIEQAGAKMGPDGVYRWTNGQPMKTRIETNSENVARTTILQLAQEEYKNIGIQVDALTESFNTLLEHIRCCGTDFDGWISGFTFGDPVDQYNLWDSKNIVKNGFNRWRLRSADADKLLEEVRNGPDCTPATRNANAHKIDQIINDQAPVIFLYDPNNIYFANKKLQNFAPNAAQPRYNYGWNVEKWWLKK